MTAPRLVDQTDRDSIANDLDTTLVVEAAAGTGKTTELVRRIVRTIESGRAEVKEIVAVTFTEKAAGELKLRLREALEKARRASSGENVERLDNALSTLEEAQVSTIHGFCADLLRERPIEARVDPLFAVLTEGQARRIYDDAFRRWLEEQLVDPPEGIRRSLRRPSFGGFGPFADKDDGPIDRLWHAGWELIQWRDFEGRWQRAPFDRDSRVDRLAEQLKDFVALLEPPGNDRDNLYYDCRPARQLRADIERLESAETAERDHDRLESRLIDLAKNRDFQRARKGTGRQYREGILREDVWQAREQLLASLSAFERDANADLAALLQQELAGCVTEYEKAKSRAGALDFLDLLLKTRDLITQDAGVRGSFQQRFKRIFVDEFQDTDPLQAEILMLLASDDESAADWRSVRTVPGKLFMVGDPKQSIYRFRRADVEVYRSVYERLQQAGARRVTLRTSFRSRPNIQRVINASFEPAMRDADGDIYGGAAVHADYVALEPFRPDASQQPSVVVLPVPKPYGTRRVSNVEIEKSLPDAVGAYIDWLINKSGWKIAERPERTGHVASAAIGFIPGEEEHVVPIQARHICLLFRRFVSYGQDMTRAYVEAMEARGVQHLLVGGRSFHNRSEIESLRAALAAIEWPEDELSVFATLRGSLFALGDEELLEYRHQFKAFHPFRIPKEFDARFSPIVSALRLLRSLHESRNRLPVATTISMLLDATRAHVGFALEHGGEQVLANVTHVAELARRYEAEGGISFRGFIDELRDQAESGEAGEAPILEEGSDGVRLMTVHKAKGLEFPVVILADMTAKLHSSFATRYIDSESGMCAVRLAGCSPIDLIQHEADELRRDNAEGVRIAYVAATRARDLLVIPGVGDEQREGWIQPLNLAAYPPYDVRRQPAAARGCPEFASKDTVLTRPDGDPALPTTVAPGLHSGEFSIVWWDPRALTLGADAPLGIRRPELIVKDVAAAIVESGLSRYNTWRAGRDAALSQGARPELMLKTVTQWAKEQAQEEGLRAEGLGLKVHGTDVQVIEVGRNDQDRPTGARFGTLVHAVLASVPLDAKDDLVEALAATHGRALGVPQEEVDASIGVVRAVLSHKVLDMARQAAASGRCRREVPVTLRSEDGGLIEGVIDLAFEHQGAWTVVDFKTDEQFRLNANAYPRQLGLYAAAIRAGDGKPVSAILMRV